MLWELEEVENSSNSKSGEVGVTAREAVRGVSPTEQHAIIKSKRRK